MPPQGRQSAWWHVPQLNAPYILRAGVERFDCDETQTATPSTSTAIPKFPTTPTIPKVDSHGSLREMLDAFPSSSRYAPPQQHTLPPPVDFDHNRRRTILNSLYASIGTQLAAQLAYPRQDSGLYSRAYPELNYGSMPYTPAWVPTRPPSNPSPSTLPFPAPHLAPHYAYAISAQLRRLQAAQAKQTWFHEQVSAPHIPVGPIRTNIGSVSDHIDFIDERQSISCRPKSKYDRFVVDQKYPTAKTAEKGQINQDSDVLEDFGYQSNSSLVSDDESANGTVVVMNPPPTPPPSCPDENAVGLEHAVLNATSTPFLPPSPAIRSSHLGLIPCNAAMLPNATAQDASMRKRKCYDRNEVANDPTIFVGQCVLLAMTRRKSALPEPAVIRALYFDGKGEQCFFVSKLHKPLNHLDADAAHGIVCTQTTKQVWVIGDALKGVFKPAAVAKLLGVTLPVGASLRGLHREQVVTIAEVKAAVKLADKAERKDLRKASVVSKPLAWNLSHLKTCSSHTDNKLCALLLIMI
jgi:hypothetical protein